MANNTILKITLNKMNNISVIDTAVQMHEFKVVGQFDKIKIEGESSDKTVGGGFQAGMIAPTKWSVISLTANALFADFYGMDLRKKIGRAHV